MNSMMKVMRNGPADDSGLERDAATGPETIPETRAIATYNDEAFSALADSLPIARFAEHIGREVSGLYRLTRFTRERDRFGRPFRVVGLGDGSASVDVYAWPRNGVPSADAPVGSWVEARVRVREFNGAVTGDLLELLMVDACMAKAAAPHHPAGAELAERLGRYIGTCEVKPLKVFLNHVFCDPVRRRAFLTRPASRSHHHAWTGGLAEHSLEVAAIVDTVLVKEPPEIRSLASVAGLVHDFGKVRTLLKDGQKTKLGWVVRHEALTLELLASGFATLDVLWPDGAAGLRHLLTWRADWRDSRPLLPAVLALQLADRYSSAADARDQAFVAKPDWQRFARLEVAGPIARFWRPAPTPAFTRRLSRTEEVAMQGSLTHGR